MDVDGNAYVYGNGWTDGRGRGRERVFTSNCAPHGRGRERIRNLNPMNRPGESSASAVPGVRGMQFAEQMRATGRMLTMAYVLQGAVVDEAFAVLFPVR